MPRVYFCIPLRSKKSSKDWDKVCRLLQTTIKSIARQSGGSFEAIVACHDLPHLGEASSVPVSVIRTDREEPTDRMEQLFDKRHKKMMLAEEVYKRGGGYMVMLDADDLVSNKLVRHICENHNERGFLINTGYACDVKKRKIERVEKFSELCGSCAVFYLDATDSDKARERWVYQIGDAMHRDFAKMSDLLGRRLEPIGFPAAMYMRNHGENHSSLGKKKKLASVIKEALHRFLNSALPSRRISKQVQQEFSLQL